jgi:peptidoglycan/LPS O-acetylase OafA/YrhL
MSERGQLPSLNGWRAASILLVLGNHLQMLNGFPTRFHRLANSCFDGGLGVRFFFVISGFLITWLMLQEEKQNGTISLKFFYARRALRIFPVYFGCLLVLAGLQAGGVVSQTGTVWIQLLTFTRNFFQAGWAVDPVSTHFWSLSVEEQFYLVWPLCFVLLGNCPRRRLWFLGTVAAVSVGWKLVALLGCYPRQVYFLFEEFSTMIHVDCLAYGCAGAVLLTAAPEPCRRFFTNNAPVIFLSGGLLLIVPEVAGLGQSMQNMGCALLLMQSVLLPGLWPYRILNLRWVVQIGIISYSLYVWQELVIVLWPAPHWWFLALPMTFPVAWLSYNILEKPFFAWRSRLRNDPRISS